MKRHAKAPGSNEGSGSSLFVVLALVVGLLVFFAAPASAATTASVDSVTDVSYGSAHLTGTINAVGETYWRFDYSTDGVTWVEGPGEAHGGPITIDGEESFEANITGLKGGTKYLVRVGFYNVTTEEGGISPEPNAEFTTLPVDPPSVIATDDASGVAYTTAMVSGKVERPTNPDPAFNVICRFQYVTDEQFNTTGFEGAAGTDCTSNPIEGEGISEVEAALNGLSPSTTYHLRLLAENAGGSVALAATSTFTTDPVSSPSVSISPPSSITAGSAEFSGSVNTLSPPGNPPEFDINWNFECTPECPGLAGGTVLAENSSSDVTVTANTTGLQPNTEYEVTLSAANAGGTITAGPLSFKTAAPAALAQTLAAGSIQTDTSILAARINPLNSPVSYRFEWGLVDGEDDGSYEHVAPASIEPLGAANNSFHLVSTPIAGLSPSTSYHFRVVASNTQTDELSIGQDRSFTTDPVSPSVEACPNESSRIGASAGLSECRALELVTPGLNSANIYRVGEALTDGSAVSFAADGAPDDAEGASSALDSVVARRSQTGWSVESLGTPTPDPQNYYVGLNQTTRWLSADFAQRLVVSNQPLAGSTSPVGWNAYLGRANGTYLPLTAASLPSLTAAQGMVAGASKNFTHFYLAPPVKQLSEDPVDGGNTYEWVNGSLRLVGILPGPGNVPVPQGAKLAIPELPAVPILSPFSDDGQQVLFTANGLSGLYLRSNGMETIEVSESERTVDPDLNPAVTPAVVGINAAGTKVIFVSRAELTNDANTGETEGVANDQGADLYSYDVKSGVLTDLTVSSNPADEATGANVERVVGSSDDASYIYFVATGNLARGGVSGDRNLYVWHEGAIDFIAPARGMFGCDFPGCSVRGFKVTPSGRHAAFVSSDRLSSYDNIDPNASQEVPQAYKYTYNGGLECASCRPNGGRPTFNAVGQFIPAGAALAGRALSNDGSRMFFQSTDAILPEASNGLLNVYAYTKGEVHLLSPGDGKSSAFLYDSSASGDDVFFTTYDDLVPDGQGAVSAIYDARVNADVATAVSPECKGEGCRNGGSSPPQSLLSGSARFLAKVRVAGPKSGVTRAAKARLRITAPEGGGLFVSGRGLLSTRRWVSSAGSVTLTAALRPRANKARLNRGVFRTTAIIAFRSKAGESSNLRVALRFGASTKKGKK